MQRYDNKFRPDKTIPCFMCRASDNGIWCCFFYTGIAWHLADFKLSVCNQCMHIVFISLQIIILRKNYSPVQLMQLPVAMLFGYLTDFVLKVSEVIQPQTYWQQWLVCIAGIILVGIGVTFEVKADIIVLAGEGLILAICFTFPIKFGTMKIIFDVSLVATACITSLIFVGGITGVREGMAAAALLVGCVVKITNKVIEKIKKQRLQAGCTQQEV